MRCCTILLWLTAIILLPIVFVFFYKDLIPDGMKIEAQTSTVTRVPPLRQQYTDKDSPVIRASTTVLGRGTLTTTGQFDVSTAGPTLILPETTKSSTTTAQPLTTTTTTVKPLITTNTIPLNQSTSPTSTAHSVNVVAKTIDPSNGEPPVKSTTTEPPVESTTPGSTEEIVAWRNFKKLYRRRYQNLEEEEKRRNIFIDNKRFIDNHNAKENNLFTLGINKFADYSNDEINTVFIGPKLSLHVSSNYPPKLQFLSDSDKLMESVDFRNTTAGEPVDQGLCLDSAVYAAIGSIESAIALARQTDDYAGSASSNIKLSEQQVIDCFLSSKMNPQICSGNVSLAQVFEFLQKVPASGLVSHQEYLDSLSGLEPAQVCNISHPKEEFAINSYGIVHQEHILEALANSGPLAFPIDASQSSFHFYKSGIFHSLDCSLEQYNYHSLLMGYNPEYNGTESHYIIRNSFGKDWGEGGYMRLLKSPNRNKCLPQKVAFYPNLSSS